VEVRNIRVSTRQAVFGKLMMILKRFLMSLFGHPDLRYEDLLLRSVTTAKKQYAGHRSSKLFQYDYSAV
jgi:hypothetical protein